MPKVLVYGGAGQLGEAVVHKFIEQGWEVVSVDFRPSSIATSSITLTGAPVAAEAESILSQLGSQHGQFDALINVAGGWAGGGIKSASIFEGVDMMWKFNVQSAVASAHIAAALLKEGSLLVMTGASAALGATPGMIAYGITKAATHHLVLSLSQAGSGLPNGTTVAAICPVCLDTKTNRQGMPGANFDDWTPLETVADLLYRWAADTSSRPASGTLVEMITKDKHTDFISKVIEAHTV